VSLGGRGLHADRRAPTADPELRRLKPGVFLYAAPQLADRNFAQTVVLLIEHGPTGSLGLVIDRPSEMPATEVLGESSGLQDLRVYWGGPVQPEALFGLVRTNRPGEGAKKVLDGVYMTASRVELEAAARGNRPEDRVRIYLGYAGWGAGQLDAEVKAGGWLIAPGEPAAVFSTDPEGLWERAYQLLERIEVRLQTEADWNSS
jgi:putative transcriptional regulator